MTSQHLADPLPLLLPEATEEDIDLAERLARALCILSSDAADSGSSSVHVQLESARDEPVSYTHLTLPTICSV